MEQKLIIIKRTGDRVEFLRHERHEHFWTKNRSEAMEYSRRDVAEGLAGKYNGTIERV